MKDQPLHVKDRPLHVSEDRFKALIRELMDENPFAVRALLRIVTVTFTNSVSTLAVTLEERPRLLVNLDFVQEHCQTDAHVKALLCHEYLHVLLGHTERFSTMTPALNLALDCVINAILHRQLGADYSGFMSAYYAHESGLGRLLRPMTEAEERRFEAPAYSPVWGRAWCGVYAGKLVADDILALAKDLGNGSPVRGYLGNHEPRTGSLPPTITNALDAALRQMNGEGVWRAPGGTNPYEALVRASEEPLTRWRRTTFEALRECLLPDTRSRLKEACPNAYTLPLLNAGDRRGFVRSLWSPFLPEVTWVSSVDRPQGLANVYLDVSGSMMAEMPQIIALLHRLRFAIRQPFWAFSDVVARAQIVRGQLIAQTTGGTSMSCVLSHIQKTQPCAALILTDGYVETVDRALLAATGATRLRALVTRDGSAAELERAGIVYHQLERFPQ